MENEELQEWVRRISEEWFKKTFSHRARFNHRLRSTGGRYLLRSHDIEINPHQLNRFGKEEVERIIKHELCHYHLHIEGKGYRHRDADFKALLEEVGGSRFCQLAVERKLEAFKYKVTCSKCKHSFKRRRKINIKRYVCAGCHGRLIIERL
jgi:SprT-like protein